MRTDPRAVMAYMAAMYIVLAGAVVGCGLFGDSEQPTLPLKLRDDQFCEQGIGEARAAYAEVKGLIEIACVEASAVPAVQSNCQGVRDASKIVVKALNRNDCELARTALLTVDSGLRTVALSKLLAEQVAALP